MQFIRIIRYINIYVYIYILNRPNDNDRKKTDILQGHKQTFWKGFWKGLYKCIFCQNSFSCTLNMYIFASKMHLWKERKYQHCILCFRCQSVGNKSAGRRGKNSSENSQVMDSNTSQSG